jgi:dienelactone hydrolase
VRPGFRLVLLAIVVFRVSEIASAQAASTFQFRFTETHGPYPVGIKVVDQYDRSRSFGDGTESSQGKRPLQTLVWYPAEKSNGKSMTLGDYAELIKTETSFDKPIESGKPQAFVAAYMHGTTDLHTWAVRDAAMKEGHFPVVIYAPSVNSPATENVELCEYLASEGFVVLASPSMGAESRTMSVDITGANAEAQDISFLIDYANSLPDANMSEIASMGYSWGGMGALFATARDKRIRALISLDGSFRYAPETVQQTGDVHPGQLTIPLLVFSRAEETLEAWDATRKDQERCTTAPNVLNEWTHADLVHVRMLAMSHIQFSSLYQRSERFRREAMHFAPADYSLEEGAISYNWMARYALEFLNAYLNNSEAAHSFLARSAAENGIPKHILSASIRPAEAKRE